MKSNITKSRHFKFREAIKNNYNLNLKKIEKTDEKKNFFLILKSVIVKEGGKEQEKEIVKRMVEKQMIIL